MYYPGEVHFVPPDAEEDGDSKFRRHVLLANCDDGAEAATFAYASSQPTEAAHGAANVLVNPTATRYRRTGFDRPTYVYPSRIVSIDPQDIREMQGRIIDEMPMIRSALEKAIGLGTGTASGPGPAAGSWRGRFIRLGPSIVEELGATFAVIVTDPEYSKAQRYQTVVPIVSALEYDEHDRDVLVANTDVLAGADPSYRECFLWTEAIFSVFTHRDIDGMSPQTLDDATMAELEEGLRLYFEL